MSLSREEWLYGFEDFTPFFAAMVLKDAYTRFYSLVLWLFDVLLLRKPVTEDFGRALPALPTPSECSRRGVGEHTGNPRLLHRQRTEDRRHSRRQDPPKEAAGLDQPPLPNLRLTLRLRGRCEAPDRA